MAERVTRRPRPARLHHGLLVGIGNEPVWRRTGLAPESRAQLAAIDLHFHDLRHEAASRLLEAGWPLHHVQEMLGHASIEQTTTYLNVKAEGLAESMRKLDEVRSGCKPVAIGPVSPTPVVIEEGRREAGKHQIN